MYLADLVKQITKHHPQSFWFNGSVVGHFWCQCTLRAITLGCWRANLQHFEPLYDFPLKVLLKYTSWNILTYSDTDNDNTPDFYSQFYVVFSSLFLCILLLNAELSLKSKRTRRLLGQYLLNQIIHLKWKACNIFSSSIIFPDFSLFLFTGENLG